MPQLPHGTEPSHKRTVNARAFRYQANAPLPYSSSTTMRGPLPGEVHRLVHHEGRARQGRRALWNPSQSRQTDDSALPRVTEVAVTEVEVEVAAVAAVATASAAFIAASAPTSSGW